MLVTHVQPSSFSFRKDIKPGDRLISVDGQPLRDRLDLTFAESGRGSEVELVTRSGEVRRVKIPAPLGEGLGLGLEEMEPRLCDNKCIFCFIHQLPKGMRRSLYVKDEDYRYSFLFGNFVTLTNLTPDDIDRILKQRLSPLYVSVHATDEAVRRRLLGVDDAPELLPLMREIGAGGVKIHCQIVVCPGSNDGAVLERTVEDLWKLGGAVVSVGIVPVGLTAHRRGLPPLKPVERDLATEVVRFVERCQGRFRASRGSGFVYAADELYMKAGLALPPASSYDGFPQRENGVGIARRWLDECKRNPLGPRALEGVTKISVVTGTLAAPLVEEGIRSKLRRCRGVAAEVRPVENRFFGKAVTVAGLLTGGDMASALSGIDCGDLVCVPPASINRGVALDDMSLPELASELGSEVRLGLRGRSVLPGARGRAGAA